MSRARLDIRGTSILVVLLSTVLTVSVRASNIPEQEPNNTCPGQAIHCNDTVDPANIDPAGDIDWYTFNATAGDLITIETSDGSGGCAGVWDTVIYLYASNCTSLLTSDDDSGQGFYSKITNYSAPYTGAYDIKVTAYNDQENGCYRLDLSCRGVAGVDASDAASLEATVTPNPTSRGCQISLRTPAAGPLAARIVDVQGREVWRSDGWAGGKGYRSFVWDGRSADGRLVPAGIYLVRVACGAHATTERIVIAR